MAAATVRIAFAVFAPSIGGDAIHYNQLALTIAQGEPTEISPHWYNLAVLWESVLHLIVPSKAAVLVLSSLIPGVALVPVVYVLASAAFDRKSGLLAAGFTAFHPRLIQASINGYTEALLAMFVFLAMLGLLNLRHGSRWIGWGVITAACCACAFLIRQEFIPILLLFLAIGAYFVSRKAGSAIPGGVLLGLALSIVMAYAGFSTYTIGGHGLFAKAGIFAYEQSLDTDPVAATKEVYAKTRIDDQARRDTVAPPQSLVERLVARSSRNLQSILITLPKALLSPLVLCLALPIFRTFRRRSFEPLPSVLLVIVAVYPIAVYCIASTNVVPRFFVLTVIAVNVLGGAVLAPMLFDRRQIPLRHIKIARYVAVTAIAAVFFCFAVTGYLLGDKWSNQTQFDRAIGAWVNNATAPDEKIAGDGWGFINTVAYWADRPFAVRPWVDNEQDLRANAHEMETPVLLLFEAFLRPYNPELLPVLDDGLESATLLAEFRNDRLGRVQVYRFPIEKTGAEQESSVTNHAVR